MAIKLQKSGFGLSKLMLAGMSMFLIAGCASEEAADTTASNQAEQEVSAEKEVSTEKEIPEITFAWGQGLHDGILQLAFEIPEAFEGNSTHLRPLGDTKFELVKDGEVIANVTHINVKAGSEAVTLMSQGQLDISGSSSTAFLQGYDGGTDLQILAPVQNGGISLVAEADAPYDNFDEFVAYAKAAEKPVLSGYHSAISAPRVIFEYAMMDEGLKVAQDASDPDADVILADLKGTQSLIPSLTSGQVEIFPGPVPFPQTAEAQGVGKTIETLSTLQDGKWEDFPCCVITASTAMVEENPEIVQALVQTTHDITEYANANPEAVADALADWVGIDKEVLMKNDTVYSTDVTDRFVNGMEYYSDFLNEMGKFTGTLKGKSFEEIQDEVFNYTFIENVE